METGGYGSGMTVVSPIIGVPRGGKLFVLNFFNICLKYMQQLEDCPGFERLEIITKNWTSTVVEPVQENWTQGEVPVTEGIGIWAVSPGSRKDVWTGPPGSRQDIWTGPPGSREDVWTGPPGSRRDAWTFDGHRVMEHKGAVYNHCQEVQGSNIGEIAVGVAAGLAVGAVLARVAQVSVVAVIISIAMISPRSRSGAEVAATGPVGNGDAGKKHDRKKVKVKKIRTERLKEKLHELREENRNLDGECYYLQEIAIHLYQRLEGQRIANKLRKI